MNARRVLAAGCVVVLMAGCADPAARSRADDVVRARADAVTRADAMLAKFASAGTEVGRSAVDWCDPGETGPPWTAAYSFKCGLERRMVLRPAESDPRRAAASMRSALREAGCDASTPPDSEAESWGHGTAEEVFAGIVCAEGPTVNVWMFTNGKRLRGRDEREPFNATGFWVGQEKLPAAASDAADSTTPFVWWVSVADQYVYVPR